MYFRSEINQINWFKISAKPSDKNIPNIYQIFPIYQIKKLYTKHFENIFGICIYQLATLLHLESHQGLNQGGNRATAPVGNFQKLV